jgi:hypothetical protein
MPFCRAMLSAKRFIADVGGRRRVAVDVAFDEAFPDIDPARGRKIDQDTALLTLLRLAVLTVRDAVTFRHLDPCGACLMMLHELRHGLLLQGQELLPVIEIRGFILGKKVGRDRAGVPLQRKDRQGDSDKEKPRRSGARQRGDTKCAAVRLGSLRAPSQPAPLRPAARPFVQPLGQGCAFARQVYPLISERRVLFSLGQPREASGLLTIAADACS